MDKNELLAKIEHLEESVRDTIVRIYDNLKARLHPDHHADVDAAITEAVTVAPAEAPPAGAPPAGAPPAEAPPAGAPPAEAPPAGEVGNVGDSAPA